MYKRQYLVAVVKLDGLHDPYRLRPWLYAVARKACFQRLRARGLSVRHPERTVATADHSTPTHPRSLPIADPMAAAQVQQLTDNCREFGICLLYTSDAADDMQCVDLGGRRIIKKIFFFQAEDGIRDES